MSKKTIIPSLLGGALIAAMSGHALAASDAPAANGSSSLEQRVEALEQARNTKALFSIHPAAEVLYQYHDWVQNNKGRGGDFYINKFILRAEGSISDNLSYDARWDWALQSGQNLPAWMFLDYTPSAKWNVQIGLTPQPFGAAYKGGALFSSYLGDLPLYLGLENNADMGIKAIYTNGRLTAGWGFYKNPENEHGSAHFRPDVTALGDITIPGTATTFRANDDPVNQLNGTLAYTVNKGSNSSTTVGATARVGQLYNIDTRKKGDHSAEAAFVTQEWGRWGITLQAAHYQYNPKRPAGQSNESVALSDGRLMPASGDIYSTRVSYAMPMHLGPFNKVKLFDDFDNLHSGSHDAFTSADVSYNIGGLVATTGRLSVYLTVQSGKNASVAFVGPDVNDNKWHNSFNFITTVSF